MAGPFEDRSSNYSEETAREIDAEVKRVLDESLEKVREILQTRRDALAALSEQLMETESIDSEELKAIIEEHSPGPRVVPGTGENKRLAASGENANAEDRTEKSSNHITHVAYPKSFRRIIYQPDAIFE